MENCYEGSGWVGFGILVPSGNYTKYVQSETPVSRPPVPRHLDVPACLSVADCNRLRREFVKVSELHHIKSTGIVNCILRPLQ